MTDAQSETILTVPQAAHSRKAIDADDGIAPQEAEHIDPTLEATELRSCNSSIRRRIYYSSDGRARETANCDDESSGRRPNLRLPAWFIPVARFWNGQISVTVPADARRDHLGEWCTLSKAW